MTSEENSSDFYSGAWTNEEEEYAETLISEYKAGNVPPSIIKPEDEASISLRVLLATELGCKAKRISKKYEGTGYEGRQHYNKDDELYSSAEGQERRDALEAKKERFVTSRKEIIEALKQKAEAKAAAPKDKKRTKKRAPKKRKAGAKPWSQSGSPDQVRALGTAATVRENTMMGGSYPQVAPALTNQALESTITGVGNPNASLLLGNQHASLFGPTVPTGSLYSGMAAGMPGMSAGIPGLQSNYLQSMQGLAQPSASFALFGGGIPLQRNPYADALASSSSEQVLMSARAAGGPAYPFLSGSMAGGVPEHLLRRTQDHAPTGIDAPGATPAEISALLGTSETGIGNYASGIGGVGGANRANLFDEAAKRARHF